MNKKPLKRNVQAEIETLLPFTQFYDADNKCWFKVVRTEGLTLTPKGLEKKGQDICTVHLKREE
jgi:hypothetical protein